MAIDQINNGERADSVRAKLNQAIREASGLSDLNQMQVPVKDSTGNFVPSGMTVDPDTNDASLPGSLRIGIGSLNLDDQFIFSGAGEVPALTAEARGIDGVLVTQVRSETGDYELSAKVPSSTLSPLTIVQSDRTQNITNPSFEFTTTFDQDLFYFHLDSVGTYSDIIAEMYLVGQTTPFWRETQIELTAGENTMKLRPAIRLNSNQTYRMIIKRASGEDAVLRGDGSVIYYGIRARSLTSTRLSYITDIPAAVTPRTNEEIFNVIADALQQGTNVTLTRDDDNNTITISASGTTPPPDPGPPILYYGLTQNSDPSVVNLSSLTSVDPTDPQTVSTGTVGQGDYFIILTPNTHDISSIRDTVLDQDVTDIFTKTTNAISDSGTTFNAYVIGPLNAGVDETYVVRF